MHTNRRPYKLPKPLICTADTEITSKLVFEYIDRHEERAPRYKYLEQLYKGFHDIFAAPEKEEWKPDNRLAVNFPKYITDTFMGYAYGVPVKKKNPDQATNDALTEFDRKNRMTDHDFELEKQACIFGHSFEYIYQDEDAATRVTVCSPKRTFIVYDDTVQQRAMFAVRYGYRADGVTRYGEVITRAEITQFVGSQLQEPQTNPYGRLPVVEYALNTERMGIFEEIAGMTETYNKAIGEKANDIDSFAEAYLAVLGAEMDEDGIYKIRDNRIINFWGTDNAKDIVVQFLQKPTADGSQESLLDRLETLIYQIAMVANISDESFGTASGVALAYKLQPMSNLALTADRKMQKSMDARYKLFCAISTNGVAADAWQNTEYTFTRNIPKNTLEEAQTAAALEGIVSKETQLKGLSIVSDVADELVKIDKETSQSRESAVENRLFAGVENGQHDLLGTPGSAAAGSEQQAGSKLRQDA